MAKSKSKSKRKAAEVDTDENENAGVDFEGGEDSEGLVVDFDDVDENQQYEVIPQGVYDAVVSGLEYGLSQASGNPMWTWELTLSGGDWDGRKVFSHTTFNPDGLPRTKKVIMRVMPELLDRKPFSPEQIANEGILVGAACQVKLNIKMYQNQKRNNVREILAPSDGGDFMDD